MAKFLRSPGGTVENHENPQSAWPVSGQTFDPRSVSHSPTTFGVAVIFDTLSLEHGYRSSCLQLLLIQRATAMLWSTLDSYCRVT
jgi:hypothetical protein